MSCVKQYVRTRRTFQIHTQSWIFLPQLKYEDLQTPAVCQRAADSAQMSEKYQTSVFHSFKSYSSAAGERDGELSITSQHLFAIWAFFCFVFFPRVNHSSSVKESVRSITSPAHPGLCGVRIRVGTNGKQLSVQCGRKGLFLPSGGNCFPRLLEPL